MRAPTNVQPGSVFHVFDPFPDRPTAGNAGARASSGRGRHGKSIARAALLSPRRVRGVAAALFAPLIAMDLTKTFLKAKRPCAEGFRWFIRHHQDGGNYQEILDAFVSAGRVNDACWLLTQFGPTDEILVVDAIDAEAVVFAGTLQVRGNIEADSIVRAGRSIQAGGSIRVGSALIAGEDIRADGAIRSAGTLEAGGDIKAGWGVEARERIACGGDLRAAWDLLCGERLNLDGNAFVGQDLIAEGAIACAKGLRAGGNIVGADSICAGHGIVAGEGIRCALHLEAGWGIKAGEAIVAEGAIRAGESLHAQAEIRAGAGYGVFAGLNVQVEAWETSARVCASARPEGLMSGCWAGASLE